MSEKYRLLFVDDNEIACKIARRAYSDICDITYAQSMADAIKLATENEFDVFLFDHMFPVGSGLELARIIRAMEGSIPKPIILVSSAMNDELAHVAYNEGVNVCLDKLTPQTQVRDLILKLVRTPFFGSATRTRVSTRTLKWRNRSEYFEYSPELALTVSGASPEEAFEKMERALDRAFRDGHSANVYIDDIKLSTHVVILQK